MFYICLLEKVWNMFGTLFEHFWEIVKHFDFCLLETIWICFDILFSNFFSRAEGPRRGRVGPGERGLRSPPGTDGRDGTASDDPGG